MSMRTNKNKVKRRSRRKQESVTFHSAVPELEPRICVISMKIIKMKAKKGKSAFVNAIKLYAV